jgi:phosphate transport system substrate-binding protein
MLNKFATGIAGLAIAAVGVAAVAANISGAGATFPAPVYQKWAEAYKAATGNQLNYQAIGSGGGIKQIEASTVDFGRTCSRPTACSSSPPWSAASCRWST